MIAVETKQAIGELLSIAKLQPEQVVVVGCSTSEIKGSHIGQAGSMEVAQEVLHELLLAAEGQRLWLAVQCCEHLNRALVVEQQAMKQYGWRQVSAVPVIHAGGSLATAAWQCFNQPVLVESIEAQAGLDIGDTFIGMHLRVVAVPVRLKIKAIGQAHVTAARSRPKLIGGARAVYIEN